jgi:hypothetical protein
MNYLDYEKNSVYGESYKDYKERLPEEGKLQPFIVFDKTPTQELGLLGIFLERISDISDAVSVAMDDDKEITITNGYGNERVVELDDVTERLILMQTTLSLMGIFGLSIREIYNANKKLKKEATKKPKETVELQ